MAIGTETIAPVDMLVGPGNAFVAEAKRQLYGRVGIDLFAGPTETMVIADDTVDAEIVRHRPARPGRARLQLARRPRHQLAPAGRGHAGGGRAPARDPADRRDRARLVGDYGEVILCADHDEMLAVANDIASEHVQVMTDRDDWYLANMHYLRRAVPRAAHQRRQRRQGDRHQPHAADQEGRPLHRRPLGRQVPEDPQLPEGHRPTRPPRGSARYCSRLCLLEGFVGHAEQANVRVRRYGHRNVPYGAPALPVETVD